MFRDEACVVKPILCGGLWTLSPSLQGAPKPALEQPLQSLAHGPGSGMTFQTHPACSLYRSSVLCVRPVSRVRFLVGRRLCRFRFQLSCCCECSQGDSGPCPLRVFSGWPSWGPWWRSVCVARGCLPAPQQPEGGSGFSLSPASALRGPALRVPPCSRPQLLGFPALRVPCSPAGEAVEWHSLGSGLRFLGYQRPPASSLVLLGVRQPWRQAGSGPLPFSVFAPLGCSLLSCRFVCFSWKFLGMLC